MKKIIITGSSGFVGSNLVKDFTNSYDLYCPKRDNLKVLFENNQKFDGIIHLAGKAHYLKSNSSDDIYYKINTQLTIQIFDKFIESDCKFFIFFSSVKACADSVEELLDENDVPNPKTPYGRSKLLAENYILNKIDELKISKLNKRIYIMRPCMIHGPNNKGNLNLLYKIVKRGMPWPLGNFKNQRSFCSIDNLSFIIKELIKNNNVKSGIYNVSDDETISTNELINLISSVLNKKNFILNIPRIFIKLLASIGDVIKFSLNSERLKKLTESYIVSNKKIKNAIGVKKMPLSAEEGLIKTINSFNN
jgi:nucleoside-diphosphate-sugar epimerase